MTLIETFTQHEMAAGVIGEPEDEQGWLRAEQEEQQRLRAEQSVLMPKKNRPPFHLRGRS